MTVFVLIVPSNNIHAKERFYYISADEVYWDYAPSHRNLMMGSSLTQMQKVFVKRTKETIGSTYKKALYREYTDQSFSQVKARPLKELHLGALGPLIRAEVGDTINVIFMNNTNRPYSIHPHGVFYDKANEGSTSNDGTSADKRLDDKIMPGNSYHYRWYVPDSAGPGPADSSSIIWLYHSHVMSIKDSNTGLVGPIIITRKGMANTDGSPKDIDREFVNFFTVSNENESWYLSENIKNTIDEKIDLTNENFKESNLKHTINGYLFGNLPGLKMIEGELVRWHLVALGTEVDLHTPHWHGHTGLVNGRRTDVVELLPASMKSLDMEITNPGTWMYHCHVNDHIVAGMTALYHVEPNIKAP